MFWDDHHPNMVFEGLNRLRLNGTLCDLILCCEDQEFPCHRSVLASFSPYFEAMFTSGMKESTDERVTVSGVEPETIGLLVGYAYTSNVIISTANVQALLAASDLWNFTAVREACCDYMVRHLDANNCVGIYCFADTHSCAKLEEHSIDYILEHFSVIYQQEEFLSLSVERMTKILASDYLNVPKEDMVFEAAMLWLDKDPSRRQTFEKVLAQIRLPLISPSYRHTVSESLDVLKECKGCQRFISEARKQARTRGKNRAQPSGTTRPGRSTVIVTMGGVCHTYKYSVKMKSFNLQTNQWKTMGLLPENVWGSNDASRRKCLESSSVVMSDSTVYLTSEAQKMWRYEITRNSWSEVAPMNETRPGLRLVMLDGYVYAVGGSQDSIERYDPSTNTWQLIKVQDARFSSQSSPGSQVQSWNICMDRSHSYADSPFCSSCLFSKWKDLPYRYPDSIECYCEETDSWETVGPMPSSSTGARYGLHCVSFRLRDDFPYPAKDDDFFNSYYDPSSEDDDW